MSKSPFLLAFLSLASLAGKPLPAQTPSSNEGSKRVSGLTLEQLFEIPVLSATKGSRKLYEAPSVVMRVEREEILESGARSLADFLRWLPGFQINLYRSGTWMAWIRGVQSTGNDKVLLVVDGAPYRELIQGNWDISEFFSIADIDHLEIIRGPGSALYGGNAYAGIISIYTIKRSSGAMVSAAAGSAETGRYAVEGGRQEGDFAWTYAASTFKTDGWTQERSYKGAPSDKTMARDGVNFQTRILLGDTWDFRLRQSTGTYSYGVHDLLSNRDYFDKYLTASASHTWFLSRGHWKNLFYGFNDRYGFDETIRNGNQTINTRKEQYWTSLGYGLDSQFNWNFTGNPISQDLTAGLFAEKQRAGYKEEQWNPAGTTPYFYNSWMSQNGEGPGANVVKSSVYAAYAQYEIGFRPINLGLTLGARMDHYEGFGKQVSPRIGLVYNPRPGSTFKALWGGSFRPPNFSQKYLRRADGQIAGTATLEPEVGRTWELEYTQKWGSLAYTRVDYFNSRYTNTIVSVNNTAWQNSNIPRIITGFEVETRIEWQPGWVWLDSVTLFANGTFLDRAYDDTGSGRVALSSLARRMANAGFTFRKGGWSLFAACNLSGERNHPLQYNPATGGILDTYHTAVSSAYPDWKAKDNLGGYAVLDLSVAYQSTGRFHPRIELTARNLGQKTYFDPSWDPDTYYDLKREPRSADLRFSLRF